VRKKEGIIMYFLNKRLGIVSVPVNEKTIRLKPGKPEMIEEGIAEAFRQNANKFIAEGILAEITEKEAETYLHKWEEYKRIPSKAMKDTTDRYLSATASYARQEARKEGMEIDVKKKIVIPAW
jgi:hypothetical protein